MLKIDKVTVGYKKVPVLHKISMEVKDGELTVLLGGNGAGKSTLLKSISGLLKVTEGKIFIDDVELTALPPHRIVDMGVIQVPEGRRIFPRMTIKENLLLGGVNIRARDNVSSSLDKVYVVFPVLKTREKQEAGTLSGGEQQMLAIARALMAKPRIVLLDEPSLGLAPNLVVKIFDTLLQLKREGLTCLLVEQNVMLSLKICNKGYILENGEIVLSGGGEALLDNRRVKTIYLGL